MLSRILIATDGSEASSHVIECIQGLRSVGSQEAVLVHVFDVRTVISPAEEISFPSKAALRCVLKALVREAHAG